MTIPRRGAGLAPLSFPQERMFLLDRIMPGIPAYNVPRLARISARLDSDALQAALDGIVARHEILRTKIVLVAGEPAQEVMPAAGVQLTVSDVGSVDPEHREQAALERVAEVAWQPFDISGDLLLRAALVHVGDGEDLLLLVNHHLGSDHVSGAMLFDELAARYDAIIAGRQPELPELEIQYADFAAWQRSYLDGDLLDELLAHWLEVLQGAPERLELPTDRPRPAAQSYLGDQLDLTLSRALTETLRSLARSANVSLFVVLLAAFDTLLHRYSGQTDIVVGTPVSGRNYEETTALVGYFSNTLPLRADLSGDPTFRELLGRVGHATRTALAYQELPFERLVQAVNPDRGASHTPIFQVLFGFDIDPSAGRCIAGARLERLPIPGNVFSRFDLSLVVRHRTDGRITGVLEYSGDLFDRCTAQRLLGHFERLVEAIAEEPDRRLSELPLLTGDERSRLLDDWNQTHAEYPAECLHELFSEQAAIRPDAIAVQFENQRLSYGELERRANQLAHELRAQGAGPGTLVGICMSRSPELLTALFAVLKSGAAYVPIDPSYPPQRVAFMLRSADVPVLLTEERLVSALPAHDAEVICLDQDWERISTHSPEAPGVEVDPSALAYVIYTSGSTGKPKGVEIAHRSVVNLITHMRGRPGLDEHDIVANLTTHAFDLSVPDWYLPLCHGAQLVIVPSEETLDGVALADRLRRAGATFVQATPTTWQLLLDAAWHGSDRLKIVCGGEAVPRALANELVSRGAELWHMYGPTETTVWSSILQLKVGDGPVPLGGPISNTRFYVLDGTGQPVPVGVPGELHIGGDGLARGYRGREDLTAERFVPDPFSAAPDARIYKTGDLVRWREDATLQFLGRIDQQVKLRGFRIELTEVEAVLAGHPLVGAVAAVVREDAPGDRRLVAYFVPAGRDSPAIDELRNLTRGLLPPYMVPSAFVELDSMPSSANRKLDRAALPAPGGQRTVQRPYTPPTRPVEFKLIEIWQEILGVEEVGVDDDFFDLGGHSLLAVKLLARIVETLDVELKLTSIFDHPTIGELGDLVAAQLLGEASEDDLEAMLAEIEAGL
jgi:amino acid adenylation domain-containing protein